MNRRTDTTWDALRALAKWERVRWIVALVLLTAACLKAHQLATEPSAGNGILSSQRFLIGLVNFEVFLAAWLVSNHWPLSAWRIALLTFALFAIVSVIALLHGAETCGCFGRVSPSPTYILLLDIALTVAVWWSQPQPNPVCRPVFSAFLITIGAWACIAVPLTFAIAKYSPDSLTDAQRTVGDSGLVIFEPEKWVGKRFPIIQHLRVDANIASGDWLVFLHQHGCSTCSELVPKYVEWAHHIHSPEARLKIAFLEVPPLTHRGQSYVSPDSAFASGTLNEELDWFIHTPTLILVTNGLVTSVEDAEKFLDSAVF